MSNKTIIITGASGGLGKALLEECSKLKANIIAHSRVKNKEFDNFVNNLINAHGNYIQKTYFDLNDEEKIQREIKDILARHNNIDVLINNASIMEMGNLITTKIDNFKNLFQVNLFSHILITQLIVRKMIRQKQGHIINIGSMNGNKAIRGSLAYNITKSSIQAFTSNLACELGDFNIKVNCIAPGMMNTKMIDCLSENDKNNTLNKTCLKKIISTQEIAKTITFLISNDINITGQTINIDSGFHNA